MALGERFCKLIQKYGKVSAVSITGLYVAIKNNVGVESIFEKVGRSSSGVSHDDPTVPTGARPGPSEDPTIYLEQQKKKNMRKGISSRMICHSFPVRLSVIIALSTPPIARFLAKWNILKK